MAQEVPSLNSSRRRRLALAVFLALAAVVAAAALWGSGARRRAENRRIVAEAARRLDLSPELLLAVAEVESGLDEQARSDKGAQGLLQVMPETGRDISAQLRMSADPLEREDHALVGGTYLKALLARYRMDLHLALAAYHAGPTRVDEWVARGRGLPGPEVVEMFAFGETRKYVADVLQAKQRLEAAARASR